MSANPFLDRALVHGDLYRGAARLAHRTQALHHAKISGRDVAATIADLLAARIPPGGVVLDIGCGRGRYCNKPQSVPASAVMVARRVRADVDAQSVDGHPGQLGKLLLGEGDALQIVQWCREGVPRRLAPSRRQESSSRSSRSHDRNATPESRQDDQVPWTRVQSVKAEPAALTRFRVA